MALVLNDGAGDAETARLDFLRGFCWTLRFRLGIVPLLGCEFVYGHWGLLWNKKFREHVLERGVIGTLECLKPDGIDTVLRPVEQGQVSFCAPDIAGKNHLVLTCGHPPSIHRKLDGSRLVEEPDEVAFLWCDQRSWKLSFASVFGSRIALTTPALPAPATKNSITLARLITPYVSARLRKVGFRFVCVDLEGYRPGGISLG